MTFPVTEHTVKTARHTTWLSRLRCGRRAADRLRPRLAGALAVAGGTSCRALPAWASGLSRPDMRGYGRSSIYARHEDYALEHDRRGHDRAAGTRSAATRRCGSATTGAAPSSGTWRATIPTSCWAWPTSACPISRGLHARRTSAAGRPRDLSGGRVPGRAVGLSVLLRGELRQGAARASRPTSATR